MSFRFMRAVVLLAGCVLLALPAHAGTLKMDVPKGVEVATVTLQGNGISLRDALEKVKAQTKIHVLAPAGEDPKLDLDLKDVPFWQALDQLATKANLRLSLYREDGRIALVRGPAIVTPVCYSGPFRIALMRLSLDRHLDTGGQTCKARLEVAWQPPFQAFALQTRPETIVVENDKGEKQALPPGGKESLYISNKIATQVDLTLPVVPRAVPHLGLLKGTFGVDGSGRLLTFTLNQLQKGQEEKQDGVKVTLSEMDTPMSGDSPWSLSLKLTYPAGGPKLESFQNNWWLGKNEIFLVKKADGRIFPNNARSEIDDSKSQMVIIYRFIDEPEKKRFLGKPADWKLVYRTPSPLLTLDVPFEFKNVPLP